MSGMDTSSVRALVRWTAPVAVIGVIAAAAQLPSTTTASAHPALPARSAAQLLADVAGSTVSSLSGTVVHTARLGLPELPAKTSTGTSSPLALLSGSHTVKVWLDGPQRQRVARISQLAEYDVIRNGRNAWTYSSESNKVTHAVLPAAPAKTGRPEVDGGAGPGDPGSYATPGAAADAALKAVDPTTAVTVDRTARVAGRPVYQLVLAPRDSASLVTSVRVAIDSVTKVPLRVQVWGSRDRAKPALEVGFTDVRFRRPAASVFNFTAPAGADVTQLQVPTQPHRDRAQLRSEASAPRVLGRGWTSVAVIRTGSAGTPAVRGTGASADGASSALLDKLTTRVTGGRLLRTALLSVLLTDDGRLLVGAVAPERLSKVASSAAAR